VASRQKARKGKNAGKDPDTPPLSITTASQTNCNFYCPLMHCHAQRWGGGISLGRDGESWKHEMMMWGWWWDDWLFTFFLHFKPEELEQEGEHLLQTVMRKWLPAGEAIFQMTRYPPPLSPHRSEVQVGIIFMDKILKEDGSRKVLLTYLYTCWLILLIPPGPYRALWGMARSVSSCSSAVRITCLFDKVLIGEFRSSYVYRRISSFSTVFNLEV
jgi:hypothetical protein